MLLLLTPKVGYEMCFVSHSVACSCEGFPLTHTHTYTLTHAHTHHVTASCVAVPDVSVATEGCNPAVAFVDETVRGEDLTLIEV